MQRRRRTRALVAAVAAFAVALTLASCGGDDSTSAGTTTAETTTVGTTTTETTTTATTEPEPDKPIVVRITVVEGVPQGGIARTSVDKGDRVVLVVSSDVADEVHVHGYDVSRHVRAGGTARIAFPAKLPGRFEVELEERGTQIAELTVNP